MMDMASTTYLRFMIYGHQMYHFTPMLAEVKQEGHGKIVGTPMVLVRKFGCRCRGLHTSTSQAFLIRGNLVDEGALISVDVGDAHGALKPISRLLEGRWHCFF